MPGLFGVEYTGTTGKLLSLLCILILHRIQWNSTFPLSGVNYQLLRIRSIMLEMMACWQ